MHVDKVGMIIKNKSHYHKACVANNYFVPECRSNICTMEFLKEVRAKTCWVPLLSDMSFRPCVYPPTNQQLSAIICKILVETDYKDTDSKPYKRLAYFLGKYHADQRFLLGILVTLDPNKDIFTRGYKPENAQKQEIGSPYVSNADHFLEGLPMLSQKELKKRGNQAMFLTKTQRI